MAPRRITESKLAEALHVSVQRINLLLNGRRDVTPDTAFRLARYFETSEELWMGLQQAWDLRSARDEGIS